MKTVLAVIVGVLVGSALNIGLIIAGPEIIPIPEGVDPTDPESLAAGMPDFKPRHFIFPFLAHALGTLVGAGIGAKIAGSPKPAYFIGGWFLLGGTVNVIILPAPLWFEVMDLVLAYIPMAAVAAMLGKSAEDDGPGETPE